MRGWDSGGHLVLTMLSLAPSPASARPGTICTWCVRADGGQSGWPWTWEGLRAPAPPPAQVVCRERLPPHSRLYSSGSVPWPEPGVPDFPWGRAFLSLQPGLRDDPWQGVHMGSGRTLSME